MNYHDQCRPSRHRVLNNYNRSTSCSCRRDAEEQRETSCICREMPPQTPSPCPYPNGGEMRAITHTPACTTAPVPESCVDSFPVAMAYVPMQKWQELYDPASGLHRGTIFRDLDLEWYPTNCRKDCRK